MLTIGIVATLIRLAWGAAEGLRLLGDARPHGADLDKYSARLWDVATGIELVGIICGLIGFGRMRLDSYVLGYFGLAAMVTGIAIRWSAIVTLGKYFNGKVCFQPDHQLVRVGLYKYVRHPAYTGSLLAHLGLGLAMANWFSLTFSVLPFVIAVWYRMRVEDEALAKVFGPNYGEYANQVKRLIPKLY